MILFIKKFWQDHKTFRKTVGVFLILAGFISLLTPATPGSWLILVGLEIFGYKILFWDKTKEWFKRNATRFFKRKA